MKDRKHVIFLFPSKLHADFKARLVYDEVPLTKFIHHCVLSYLDNDPLILELLNKYKEKNKVQNKTKRRKNLQLIEKGAKIKETFNLDNKEINDIYDILESEMEEFTEL